MDPKISFFHLNYNAPHHCAVKTDCQLLTFKHWAGYIFYKPRGKKKSRMLNAQTARIAGTICFEWWLRQVRDVFTAVTVLADLKIGNLFWNLRKAQILSMEKHGIGGELDGHTDEKLGWRESSICTVYMFNATCFTVTLKMEELHSTLWIPSMYHSMPCVNPEEMN